MPKEVETIKKETYICDFCAVRNSVEWVSLYLNNQNKIFLVETDVQRKYETFNIIGRKEIVFCSRGCAAKYLTQELLLFLSLK